MKQKAFNIRYLFAAAIFAVLALVTGAAVVSVGPAAAASTYEFEYTDSSETVITGIKITGTDKVVIDIPEKVVTIDKCADERIAGVNFAQNGALKTIGDFAFGDTSIREIAIPEGVTSIGEAAFATCTRLEAVDLPDSLLSVGDGAFVNTTDGLSVYLPNNANATYHENAFSKKGDGAPVFVSDDPEVTAALAEKLGLDASEKIAYPVTIRYNYLGTVVDTETRLFGKPYSLVKVGDAWKTVAMSDTDNVGTVLTKNRRWFASETAETTERNRVVVSVINEMLAVDGVKVIDLYSFAESTEQKVFIARNDLVYDGEEHRLDSLNTLLMPMSDRITPGMTVEITSFTKPDGTEADVLPQVIKDAGVYGMKVSFDGSASEFTINVARKKINLAAYENLFWKVTKIGNIGVSENLMSSADTVIYLYKKADDTVVPYNTKLSDADMASGGYTDMEEKTVRYAIVRKRSAAVTVGLADNEAYGNLEYGEIDASNYDNVGTEVGRYISSAVITPSANYEFELRYAPADAIKRGVTVRIEDNGKATVTKEWYIVDINNWVIDSQKNVYEIATREYGVGRFPMPILAHDVAEDQYGLPGADPVRMTLFYNGTQIGGTFRRGAEFYEYLNEGIPAGEYTLNFDVESVSAIFEEDTNGNGEIESDEQWHGYTTKFNSSVSFTVTKATMRESYVNAINAALKGSRFEYTFNGRPHLYQDDDNGSIAKALEGLLRDIPERSVVWLDERYDAYFDNIKLVYNLRRLQTDEYFVSVDAIDPDVYTVYYKLDSKNYLSSIDTISDNEDRNDYYFTVVITREIMIPQIAAKKYNGVKQVAEIEPNDIYYIIKNDGGVSAGTYEVVLKFRDPACYRWQGDETGGDSITLEFVIEQATNGWVSELSIQNWITGRYDPEVNKAVASAKFGNGAKHVTITDGNGKVVYDSRDGINRLKGAKAGTYGLRVVIDETDDYTGISDSIFFRIHKKPGLAWWVTLIIVICALGVAAGILVILWKKGVIELLTGKITLAIRTRATVDATIAAVRANKVAEEAKISVANAKAKERARQRKAAAEAERSLPVEEKAAALEAKAKAAAERAERMRAKSEAMLSRAERMREEAARVSETQAPSAEENSADREAAATTDETQE